MSKCRDSWIATATVMSAQWNSKQTQNDDRARWTVGIYNLSSAGSLFRERSTVSKTERVSQSRPGRSATEHVARQTANDVRPSTKHGSRGALWPNVTHRCVTCERYHGRRPINARFDQRDVYLRFLSTEQTPRIF